MVALYQLGGAWLDSGAEEESMKKAFEQETLAAPVSTRAAREFRVLHDGEAWRLELRLGVKWLSVRSRREPIRYRRSLTAVGRFCEAVGIKVLTVEL
jgi:hypothetical protein